MQNKFAGIVACLAVVLKAQEYDPSFADVGRMITLKTVHGVSLSPKGDQCIYLARRGFEDAIQSFWFDELFLQELSGSTKQLIVSGKYSPKIARWDATGENVYFITDKKEGKHLWKYSLSSEDKKPVDAGVSPYPIIDFKLSNNSSVGVAVLRVPLDEREKLPTFVDSDLYQNQLWVMIFHEGNVIGFWQLSEEEDHLAFPTHYDLSEDGKEVVYATSSKGKKSDLTKMVLKRVVIHQGDTSTLTSEGYFDPHFSKNGKKIAALRLSLEEGGAKVNVVSIDQEKKNRITTLRATDNQWLNEKGSILGWSQDGDFVYCIDQKEGSSLIYKLSSRKKEIIDFPKGSIESPSWLGDRLLCSFSSLERPSEGVLLDLSSGEVKTLTEENKELFGDAEMPRSERVSYTSFDGRTVQGILTYPVGYEEKKKYPLVVHLHDGPVLSNQNDFPGQPTLFPIFSFARKGWFVFRPDFRGSNGYGPIFRSSIRLGKDDVEDVLFGISSLTAVDENKIVLTGTGYGAFLGANILLKEPHRFRGALFGTGCFAPFLWSATSSKGEAVPYFSESVPFDFERRSLTQLASVGVPLLLHHGKRDEKIPLDQSLILYELMKKRNGSVELCIFDEQDRQEWLPKSIRQAAVKNIQFISDCFS